MKERIIINTIIGFGIIHLAMQLSNITKVYNINFSMFSFILLFAISYSLLLESFNQLQTVLLKYRAIVLSVIIVLGSISILYFSFLGIGSVLVVIVICFCLIKTLFSFKAYNQKLNQFKNEYKN